MNCQEAKELSSEYLDRRLAPTQVSLLEEHIETCPDCERGIEALRTTISMIGSLDAIESAPDFLVQVQRKIDKAGKSSSVWAWLFDPIRIKVPLELTALLLVGITGLFLYSRLPEISRTTPVPERLESYGVGHDKLGEGSSEEKRKTGKADKMTEGAPASARLEGSPSMPKSSVESKEALQPSGGAPDFSAKGGASSSMRASSDKADEKALDAQGRIYETDRTAKKKAVIQPAAPLGEARNEIASAPKPEMHEVLTDDVDVLEARIKFLLEKVGGKLLTQEGTSGSGLLWTVELPQHRRTEFLAAVKEESNLKSKPSAARQGAIREDSEAAKEFRLRDAQTPGVGAAKRKAAPAPESSPRTDTPSMRLQLHILPKE